MTRPVRVYTALAGGFLLLQGVSTLTALLWHAFDRAVPSLLTTTKMVIPHSSLHIGSGLMALAMLRWGGPVAWRRFAVGFGAFYTALGLGGLSTDSPTVFGLQRFDHPFHIAVGIVGLLCALPRFIAAERPR